MNRDDKTTSPHGEPPETNPPPTPPTSKRSGIPGWLKVMGVLAGLLLVVVVALAWMINTWLMPVAEEMMAAMNGVQNEEQAEEKARDMLVMQPDAPFKVNQALDLLGIKIIRLKHQEPAQDFMVVTGLDNKTADELYSEGVSPQMVESLANSLLSMRRTASGEPVTMRIVQMSTLSVSEEQVNGMPLRTKEMEVTFQLSSESTPRKFIGLMGRMPDLDGKETVILTYGAAEAFEPELMSTFFNHVTVKGSPSASSH